MATQQINQSTQVSFWISALVNRQAINAMMTDHKGNRNSMFVLIDRMAKHYGLPTAAVSFQPVYNPQDSSQWPELLGWLITMADMETV